MSAPFEKFRVAESGNAGMWLVRVWVKLRGKPQNPDWYEKEIKKLTASQKFIKQAIEEKLQRERETPDE